MKCLTTCKNEERNWSWLLELRNNRDLSKKLTNGQHRQCGDSNCWHIFSTYIIQVKQCVICVLTWLLNWQKTSHTYSLHNYVSSAILTCMFQRLWDLLWLWCNKLYKLKYDYVTHTFWISCLSIWEHRRNNENELES